MFEYDELSIYRGREIRINKNIVVTIPTLGQIEVFGERHYFNGVRNLTSVGADLKWQLWDLGIDYTKIEDYDLFIKLTSQLISSKKALHDDMIENPDKYDRQLDSDELEELLVNPMRLILKDIDFADFSPYVMQSNNQIILYNQKDDIIFDRLAYTKLVDIVRKIHGFKRNNEIPANERTKMDLIDDARDEAMAATNKPYKSMLKPLVSTLQMYCGQCGDDKIWNMPISAFFDNIKRVSKIQDAQLLLQGAYSGFASLKGIDKNRLDMFGDI